MTESEWKELVETYSREAAEEFQKTVNAYNEKKTAAQAQTRFCAECELGNAETSSVWKNFRKKKKLQKRNIRKKKRFITNCEWITRMTEKFLIHFHPGWKSENQSWRNMRRIDALYRMTSGNVSGSRMDLETYVQRYYLERILYAANQALSGNVCRTV